MTSNHDRRPYDRHYFETALGAIPYDRTHPEWLEFFGRVADHIVAEIKPTRVLDVGCAKGFLVESLRDRGVDAYGIDVSEYAIGEVRPDVRPYCRVASAVEPYDRSYDLIVCIEVLEHLSEEDGRAALANMCGRTNDVLFTSTPDDVIEPTHVNVRPRSWWIERFAEHDFQLDVGFDASFITPHGMRFKRASAPAGPLDAVLIQREELFRRVATLDAEAEGRDHVIARLHSDLGAVQFGAAAVRRELFARRLDVTSLREAGAAKDQLIGQLETLRDSLEAAAEIHKSTIEQLSRDLTSSQSDAETLRSEITSLQSDAETLRSEITTQQSEMHDPAE